MRLLFAEDEKSLSRAITAILKKNHYEVDAVYDGEEALAYLECGTYDGAILDIMMPKKDGLTVLKEIRRQGINTPVLMLTAKAEIDDRVLGLDSGANDYLVKPFDFEELLARIRAMTRSSYGQSDHRLTLADLEMDTASRQVTRGGVEIPLSAKEYQLLEYLFYNQGIVLSREKIEEHIWNYDYEGGTNVVDVYISYLRKKIDGGQKKKLIHTVRGMGYVLKEG